MENKKMNGTESDILFTRVIKAGKRVYYIDVKQDKRGEYYLSMTESKRVQSRGEDEYPIFEKHKIFLYREDMEKFTRALGEATAFVNKNAPQPFVEHGWLDGLAGTEEKRDPETPPVDGGSDFKFGVDF